MKHSWVVRGESWKWGRTNGCESEKDPPLSKEEELKRSLWFERIKKRRTDRDTKRNSCDVFPLFKPRVELLYRTSEIDPWVSPVLSVISFLFLPQALWDQNQSQVLPPSPPPSTHANMMHCHDSSKCNMIALVMKLYLFVWSSLQLQSCRNLRACKRMPPADGRLSVPRSRDGTGLQLLWSRLLQPPTRCRLWEVLKIARVDLLNRFNNSAYKLNLLLGYFFFLPLPSFLPSFLRCKCNPIGSSSVACHPITGQCVCRAGVEGRLCDSCRAGFFGFSSRGCRGTGLYFRHRKCSTLWSSHASNTDHTWRHFWLLHVYLCRSPPLPSSRPPIHLCPCVVLQRVTATQWAPFPCSVTATGPATVARALWVISVTNVSWTISTTERRTSARSAPFAMALLRSRWVCVCLWLMSVEGVLKFCLLSLQTCNYCEHNTEISHHHNYCLLHI